MGHPFDKIAVGFIQDQGDPVLLGQKIQPTQQIRGNDGAGGVAGGDQQDRPGARGDQPGDAVQVGQPFFFLFVRCIDRPDSQAGQGHRVVKIAGQLDDHLITGMAEGQHGQPEGGAGADGQADLLRVDLGSIAATIAAADCLPHLGQSLIRAVAAGLGIKGCLLDMADQLCRRGIIRNCLTEVDQRGCVVRALVGPFPDLADRGRMDRFYMFIQGKTHDTIRPLCTTRYSLV